MTHDCPGPGCAKEVDSSLLMCPACWYQVPKPIRAAVWRTWRRGAGAGTPGCHDRGDSGGEPCLTHSPP